MKDEPIVTTTTMSAEAYTRLCKDAEALGITPEELLERLIAKKVQQRMIEFADECKDAFINGG